jgi:CubicO group peptidase (beta-lactamase class C family)
MKSWIRRLAIAGLLLAVAVQTSLAQGLPASSPEAVGMSGERLERLTETLQGYVDDGRLAGAAALVARRGKVVYSEGVGFRDREANAAMTDDVIFRIASQTKAPISVGVLMLQEEGRLLIGDPVGKYLPEYLETTVAEPDGNGGYRVVAAQRPITIRDLLTHTAGIGYGVGPASDAWEDAGIVGWYFGHRDEPIRETMKRLADLPFDAQPGAAFVYGYNTDILGALIERVSGQPLDVFMRERILDPLGMVDTHFYLPPAKAARLAAVYSATAGGIERAPDAGHEADRDPFGAAIGQGAYVEGPRASFSGGAGYVSTVADYSRFLQMMANGGELEGARILSPKTVELMTTDHLGGLPFPFGVGQGFGLGFFVVHDPAASGLPTSVGEYGWYGAYHSAYWVDPEEELIVVYLTQLIPAGDIDDQAKVRALVYQAMVD